MNILEGQKLIKFKEYAKALIFFLDLKNKNINSTIVYFYLGLIYFEFNKFSKSIFYYNKFLKKEPKSEAALLNLAIAKQAIGKIEAAKELYLKIININNQNIRAYYGLYLLDINFLNNDLFKNLNQLSKNKKLNLYEKGIINFLFSKKAKINNEYDKELEYLQNSHKNFFNSNQSYNLSAQFYYNQIISNFYNKIKIHENDIKKSKTHNEVVNPIFIIGLPRSGSTLIESILTSCEENIISFGESNVFNVSILDQIGPKIYSEKFDNKKFEFLINKEKLKKSVLEKYSQYSETKHEKFVDKSLENFFNIRVIRNIYPKAKFIHTYRNPIDSVISIYQSMLPELSWTHNIENILSYMDTYYKVLKYFKSKYPEIIMDINLEEFTDKSELLTKKMFNFCELTWSKNILNFYNRKDLYSKTLSFNQIRSKVLKYNEKKYQPYFNLLNDYKNKYQWLNFND